MAFGLGALAAVMMVAGHPPWEGPTVVSLTATHGLHRGDVVALIPLAFGTGLAWWCLHRPSPAQLAAMAAAAPDEPR